MSEISFTEARSNTSDHIRSNKITDHFYYGPISSSYWEQKIRVAIVNLEPVGYGDTRDIRDEIMGWIRQDDKDGRTKSKVARYSMCFARLIHEVASIGAVTQADAQRIYKDLDGLCAFASSVAYFNLRHTSNTLTKQQNTSAIVAESKDGLSRLVANEMQALEAHVYVIGGVYGAQAFNNMHLTPTPLPFMGLAATQWGVAVSVRHPSRPNYREWVVSLHKIRMALSS
jgi:hypothetical protein